jgi:hypothetical protein
MKKIGIFAVAVSAVCLGSFLAGCKKTATVSAVAVTDFKIDFETGDYSFTGVDAAKTYYLRVFKHELAEGDADMPIAARRIRQKTDDKAYEGTLDLSDLTPGTSYDAYVYTYVKDDEGNLLNTRNTAVNGVYKKAYPTPDLTSDGFSATITDTTITVAMTGTTSQGMGPMGSSTSGFLKGEMIAKDPQYVFNLYEGESKKETKTITAADFTTETKETTSFFGTTTSTITTGKTTFSVTDASASYFVTLTLKATDSTAYYDSAESAKLAITAPKTDTGTQPGSTSLCFDPSLAC